MVFGKLLSTRAVPPPDTVARCLTKDQACKNHTLDIQEGFLDEAHDTDDEGWDFVGVTPQVGSVGKFVIDDYLTTQVSSTDRNDSIDSTPKEAGANEVTKLLAGDASSSENYEPRTPSTAPEEAAVTENIDPVTPVLSTPTGPSEEFLETTSGTESMDESGYQCFSCGRLIFKESNITSANYNTTTGPAYLISSASNVSIAMEKQQVLYSTGWYTIQEVGCQRCSVNLGVTYTAVNDHQYKYKVGKFLIGVDKLRLPPGTVHPQEKNKK